VIFINKFKKNDRFSANTTKKIILVPQGCYGVIDKDTPNDVIGLYTVGIATCSGLVCLSDDGEYLFLAHIDESTSLGETEQDSGLIRWLKNLIERKHVDFKEINLNICHSQQTCERTNAELNYTAKIKKLKSSIEQAIPQLQGKINIKLVHEHSDVIDCFVLRQDGLKELVKKKIEYLDGEIAKYEGQSKGVGIGVRGNSAIIYSFKNQKQQFESQDSNQESFMFKFKINDPIFGELGIAIDARTDKRHDQLTNEEDNESPAELYRLLSTTPGLIPLIECYNGKKIMSYPRVIDALKESSKKRLARSASARVPLHHF